MVTWREKRTEGEEYNCKPLLLPENHFSIPNLLPKWLPLVRKLNSFLTLFRDVIPIKRQLGLYQLYHACAFNEGAGLNIDADTEKNTKTPTQFVICRKVCFAKLLKPCWKTQSV